MEKYYTTVLCKRCKKETILISDEVKDTISQGKYISCSHCGFRHFKNRNECNSIKECMEHSTWKKIHGRIRQVHST